MIETSKAIHVAAAPDEVFRYVVDRDLFNPPGTTVEAVHETPAVQGNVYTWTSRMLGVPLTGVMVYMEYVPDRRLRWRNFGRFESDTTWTVEPEPGGCTLTVTNSATVRIPLLGRLLRPLTVRQMDTVLRMAKAQIERQGPRFGTAA